MKAILGGLIVLAMLTHYGLWFGHHSVGDLMRLQRDTDALSASVEEQAWRNRTLRAEVDGLVSGNAAVEELARDELGFIKPDETFFQIIESDSGRFGSAGGTARGGARWMRDQLKKLSN